MTMTFLSQIQHPNYWASKPPDIH